MTGSRPQTHSRSVDGATYIVETTQHEGRLSIVVVSPGIGMQEERDHTCASIDAALAAGDEVARSLHRDRGMAR